MGWATIKGASFVIATLLSSADTSAQVAKELRPNLKKLKASSDPGAQVIVKKLTEK